MSQYLYITVKSETSGLYLQGVSLSLSDGVSKITDQYGVATFIVEPSTSYTLIVSMSGYITKTVDFITTIGNSSAEIVISTSTTPPTPKWRCDITQQNKCIRDDINGIYLNESSCLASTSCGQSDSLNINNLIIYGTILLITIPTIYYISTKK